jgi:hypothetical protein
MILSANSDYYQLIFVIEKYGVFFAVRTELLNTVWMSLVFKGIREI